MYIYIEYIFITLLQAVQWVNEVHLCDNVSVGKYLIHNYTLKESRSSRLHSVAAHYVALGKLNLKPTKWYSHLCTMQPVSHNMALIDINFRSSRPHSGVLNYVALFVVADCTRPHSDAWDYVALCCDHQAA